MHSASGSGDPVAQKKHRRRRLRARRGTPVFGLLTELKALGFNGVGTNFKPKPRRDLRFGGGVRTVIRLWNA